MKVNGQDASPGERYAAISRPGLWCLGFALISAPYLILKMTTSDVIHITREDGPVENLGATAFLVSAGLFCIAWFRSRGSHDRPDAGLYRRRWLLGFTALCSLAFLEEVNWGQSILHFKTPPTMLRYNVQGDVNLHNLIWFNGTDRDGHRKGFWARFLCSNRLFNLTWFSCWVVAPVGASASRRCRDTLGRLGMPLAPLGVSALFIAHHAEYRLVEWILPGLYGNIAEIAEMNIAILFGFVGARFYWVASRQCSTDVANT